MLRHVIQTSRETKCHLLNLPLNLYSKYVEYLVDEHQIPRVSPSTTRMNQEIDHDF